MTPTAVVILVILGVVCLLGAFLVMRYAFTYGRPKPKAPEPLPGGGGWYAMQVEGLETDADRAKLEAALQRVPAIHAQADAQTGTVRIRYEGFPGMTLLDDLRKAAEDAGFSVTSIE